MGGELHREGWERVYFRGGGEQRSISKGGGTPIVDSWKRLLDVATKAGMSWRSEPHHPLREDPPQGRNRLNPLRARP